jgi:hypothetical protein
VKVRQIYKIPSKFLRSENYHKNYNFLWKLLSCLFFTLFRSFSIWYKTSLMMKWPIYPPSIVTLILIQSNDRHDSQVRGRLTPRDGVATSAPRRTMAATSQARGSGHIGSQVCIGSHLPGRMAAATSTHKRTMAAPSERAPDSLEGAQRTPQRVVAAPSQGARDSFEAARWPPR